MGTCITDGEGNLASSGAGIPAFVGVLDKAVKRIIELNGEPGEIAPGRRLRHERPVLRRRHASERRRAGDARLRRRTSSSPGRRTSRTGTTSAAWCPARSRTRRARSSRRACACPRVKLISAGTPIKSVMEIMKVQQPPARLPRRATCGPASPRRASASGASSSWSTSTASDTFLDRARPLHGLRRAGRRCARSRGCRRAASARRGAGQRRRLQR